MAVTKVQKELIERINSDPVLWAKAFVISNDAIAKKVGPWKARDYQEEMLRDKLLDGLSSIPRIINYGDMKDRSDRLGIGVFNIESLYHHDVAEILAKVYGISVRQGWFCAHPYCRRLMHLSEKDASAFIHNEKERMPGMIRVSFGIYNEIPEVEYFLEVIEKIVKSI